MKEEYIYSVQAAFLLQKTMREIQHMCEKGRLRATKITKGKEKLLIDASSVENIFYKQISRYNRVYKYLNLSEEERLDYWNNVEKNIQIKLNTVDYLSLKQVAYLLNVSGQAVTTMIDTKEVCASICFIREGKENSSMKFPWQNLSRDVLMKLRKNISTSYPTLIRKTRCYFGRNMRRTSKK